MSIQRFFKIESFRNHTFVPKNKNTLSNQNVFFQISKFFVQNSNVNNIGTTKAQTFRYQSLGSNERKGFEVFQNLFYRERNVSPKILKSNENVLCAREILFSNRGTLSVIKPKNFYLKPKYFDVLQNF